MQDISSIVQTVFTVYVRTILQVLKKKKSPSCVTYNNLPRFYNWYSFHSALGTIIPMFHHYFGPRCFNNFSHDSVNPHQVCVTMARQPVVLEMLFRAAPAQQGSTNLLIFSLLVPFIHRDGAIGQQARDALLLVMATSASHEAVARYIAENSYFCPVSKGTCENYAVMELFCFM